MNKLVSSFKAMTLAGVNMVADVYLKAFRGMGWFGKLMLNLVVATSILFIVGIDYIVVDNLTALIREQKFWMLLPVLLVGNYVFVLKIWGVLRALKELE